MDESQKRRVSKTSRGESTFSPSHPNRPDYLRKAAVDQPEEFTLLPISLCSKHHLCNHRFAPVASRLSFSLSSVPSSPSSSLHHRSSHHNRHIRLPPILQLTSANQTDASDHIGSAQTSYHAQTGDTRCRRCTHYRSQTATATFPAHPATPDRLEMGSDQSIPLDVLGCLRIRGLGHRGGVSPFPSISILPSGDPRQSHGVPHASAASCDLEEVPVLILGVSRHRIWRWTSMVTRANYCQTCWPSSSTP